MTNQQIINAIIARVNGVFDDPDLLLYGPLTTTVNDVYELGCMLRPLGREV